VGDLTPAARLAVLAHEVRSPVAAILAIWETLRERDADIAPEDRRRLLELALEAGRNVERLLADPDLFSVRRREVDVARLVASAAHGVVATEAIAPGVTVFGDPVRLRQALANLVANGKRHGQSVTIGVTAADGEVRIAVTDDGPGVPAGLDLFALGTSGSGSTGYGLYIVRRIAEAHGGRVELDSTPGAGATFTLVLPSSGVRG
jgi:two-component system OmpR family sensor kinase